MWDALDAFKKAGGRLIYNGANAWYWRIAYHKSKPGVIEVRRAEGGIRAWAAGPANIITVSPANTAASGAGRAWRRRRWRERASPPRVSISLPSIAATRTASTIAPRSFSPVSARTNGSATSA